MAISLSDKWDLTLHHVAPLEAQMVKNPPAMQKTWGQSLFLNASVSSRWHTVLLLFKSFLLYMHLQVLIFCLVFRAFLPFRSQILAPSLNSESVSLLRDVTPTGWKSGLAGCFSFLLSQWRSLLFSGETSLPKSKLNGWMDSKSFLLLFFCCFT